MEMHPRSSPEAMGWQNLDYNLYYIDIPFE